MGFASSGVKLSNGVGVWSCDMVCSSSRNLVSASQDGKLIVWDAYTTNKVCGLC